jgi:hypothetical protein
MPLDYPRKNHRGELGAFASGGEIDVNSTCGIFFAQTDPHTSIAHK